MSDPNHSWSGRLTRFLAGIVGSEGNELSRRPHTAEEDAELSAAWDELHAATPPGWFVGQPSFHHERNVWVQYAYDASERRRPGGPRKREWETEAPTQELCIRSMAYFLREIAAGRVPK